MLVKFYSEYFHCLETGSTQLLLWNDVFVMLSKLPQIEDLSTDK